MKKKKMKKGVKIIIIILIMIVLGLSSYFITKKLSDDYIKNNKVVENISIEKFINKFNENLTSNNFNDKLMITDEVIDKNTYWINLTDEIIIALNVDKEKKDKTSAIIRVNGIAYNIEDIENSEAEKYLKILIKTNNEKLSMKEIEDMINKSNKSKKVYKYKGLGILKIKKDNDITYNIYRYN